MTETSNHRAKIQGKCFAQVLNYNRTITLTELKLALHTANRQKRWVLTSEWAGENYRKKLVLKTPAPGKACLSRTSYVLLNKYHMLINCTTGA